MTHLNTAIKRAIEQGGYSIWNDPTAVKELANQKDRNEILLDPQFWQALSKAEGWNTWITNGGFIKHIEPTGKRKSYYKPAWLYHWHRFIDALASGKTAETFFEELLNKLYE